MLAVIILILAAYPLYQAIAFIEENARAEPDIENAFPVPANSEKLNASLPAPRNTSNRETRCLALMKLIETTLQARKDAEQVSERTDDNYEMPVAIYPELEVM
jgi:hypothetical protein